MQRIINRYHGVLMRCGRLCVFFQGRIVEYGQMSVGATSVNWIRGSSERRTGFQQTDIASQVHLKLAAWLFPGLRPRQARLHQSAAELQ